MPQSNIPEKLLKPLMIVSFEVNLLRVGMKILVAYDGSDHAKRALGEATELAKKFSGSITILHVPWEESDDESQSLLRRAAEGLKDAGIKYNVRSERGQNIPRRITRIATEENYDLITIGSRGMGGAKAWMLGSVSSTVIEEATCPVLIVK
jgi:nucleotide-binding universal stress UspA family protein